MSSTRTVGRFWRGYARHYDAIWDSPWTEHLGNLIADELVSAGSVVEVGCGTGLISTRLRERGIIVVGADLSPAMLDVAIGRGRLDAAVVADGSHLPLSDASTHSVVLANLLHVVPDPRPVLAEALRIAAPGARIIVTWPTDRLHPRQLARAERGLGWSRRAAARANVLRLRAGVPGALAGIRRHGDQLLTDLLDIEASNCGATLSVNTIAGIQRMAVVRTAERGSGSAGGTATEISIAARSGDKPM